MVGRTGGLCGIVCAAIAFVASGGLAGPPLTAETFDEWAEHLRPDSEELCYLDIAWRDTFAAGVEEAYRHRKPVLLWAMNGHPLGCT